jgi:N6-L-threonylcarbamoyladenine synthase
MTDFDFLTVLAIETSLDDTCAAVTRGNRVLSNVVASQVKFHEEYGGTVPHIAKRKHNEWIDQTIDEALRQARPKLPLATHGDIRDAIDVIAVTYGPGLAPSLEVGIAKAKDLALAWNKPLVAVNHMEGHLLSVLACNSAGTGPFSVKKPVFPVLGFLISGGHTQLVLVRSIGTYELLGETLDDAAGEAYDKVARMLQLGYPGGPILSQMALEGESRYELPEPMLKRRDLNFSFSGLKTASMYFLERNRPQLTRQFVADFSASFQAAVIKMLTRRLTMALTRHKPAMLWLGGGVVSNVEIRQAARQVARAHGVPTFIPYSHRLYTDNAAMIGVAAWYKAKRGEYWNHVNTLEREPNLSF